MNVLLLPVLLCQQATPAEASVWDRLQILADGRLRAEATYDQPAGDDRYRGRTRFRLSSRYDLLPTLGAEARLTTTSGDPNNPHWDFGSGEEGLGGSEVRLDRFFVDWRPGDVLRVRFGQFEHAFSDPPIFNEIVWDDDVQAAGLAVTVGPGPVEELGFDLRGVAYVAVENAGSSDPGMLGAQANLYAYRPDAWSLQASSSLMSWFDLDGGSGVLDNQGNTDVAGDFLIWEAFVSGTWEGGPLGRSTAFYQIMHNLEDDAGEADGHAAGLMFGRRWRRDAWNVFTSVYDLDANAIFSPPAQDATPIPGTGLGTGMSGVFSGVEYWVSDRMSLELTVLTSHVAGDDDPVRVRFDIDFALP